MSLSLVLYNCLYFSDHRFYDGQDSNLNFRQIDLSFRFRLKITREFYIKLKGSNVYFKFVLSRINHDNNFI